MTTYRPDARRSPADVQRDWSECTLCPAGRALEERRNHPEYPEAAARIHGQGVPGGIMFVDAAPGWRAEVAGCAFPVEKNETLFPEEGRGSFIRTLADKFNIPAWFTGATLCRPTSPRIDAEGNQLVQERMVRGVAKKFLSFKDRSPTAEEFGACHQRMLAEIYSVDPVLIVAFGEVAGRAVMGKPTAVSKTPKLEKLTFPGALEVPHLDKKGTWGRRRLGVWTWPTDNMGVSYPVLVTVSTADALRQQADRSSSGAFTALVSTFHLVSQVYEAYRKEGQ